MIYGIGTDIAGIQRMRDALSRSGEKLARRILTGEEWQDYAGARDQGAFLAKRFAAKEAFSKAVGTGMRSPVSLSAITVVHDRLGRPAFTFSRDLAGWLKDRCLGQIHLSLSDERDHVVAFVVAEVAE